MTKRDISMATPLKFRALVVGLGLAGNSLLAGHAQSASAQSKVLS